jgi:hypothetical protein
LGGTSLEASRFLFQIRELLSPLTKRDIELPPTQFLLQSPLVIVARTLQNGSVSSTSTTAAVTEWRAGELQSLAKAMDADTYLADSFGGAISTDEKSPASATDTADTAFGHDILITGGTGFLGTHVISELIESTIAAKPVPLIHCLVTVVDSRFVCLSLTTNFRAFRPATDSL